MRSSFFSSISMSGTSSRNGVTLTAAKAVWRLPWALNGEMRTSRCTPCSERSRP